jgi:hypothetical protein
MVWIKEEELDTSPALALLSSRGCPRTCSVSAMIAGAGFALSDGIG